jgi:DNA-binding beta-propeller fold protein YncE
LQQIGQHQPAVTRVRSRRLAVLTTSFAATFLIAGCGQQYRPVVSAINPVGPAGQPTKYAVAVSSPSATLPGLVTFVDFSGDTVLSTPSILTNPSYFALNNNGIEGFVINSSGVLNDFGTSNPTSLLTSNITQTTLPAASGPITLSAITPLNGASTLFVPETATSKIAVLSSGSSSLLEEISVGANPIYVVGADSAPRIYAISQNASGGNGQIAALEAISGTSYSVSATIPVGVKPVYGVMTSDDKRAFILNQGSGTVSVVNVINNALDTTAGTLPALPGTIPLCAAPNAPPAVTCPNVNPIWADLSPTTDQLVVLNQGDGTHPGSLSIIGIPLCSSTTQISNPLCNAANPVDGNGFGQITSTVNVGINPQMVSVLHDGTAAYVANKLDSTGTCNAGEGSVSVVSLVSGVVTATICGISTSAATIGANTSPTLIYGHPTTISATTGTPTGKVYVTSPDNQYMSIIYTDTNTVQAHVNMQGLGVRVLVTSP